ncbi:iron ABC transporter substrate-binding protein [Pseudomonas sp. PA15(2017)]|uniref:ABC transporter substrate-binding protein n=1 Tax=Pseudomonas sp. PA15(2017) TaxID=1932111 RepID=UPI00095CBC02|nr:ABC transporter substrate-binding protein [Pseudomonas sp. PA15(2017)]OLU28196.1 iron ABC transporter substrate-binding protein [Pseudomonas sp. PA15(2017)]
MIKPLLVGCLLSVTAIAASASTTDYPLTVRSCDRQVTFDQAPQRVVVHDISLASMLLSLGLHDRIIGYTGFGDSKPREPWVLEAMADIPQLASRYPSIETLLDAEADLFFAGWSYGMRVGGPVTPATLQPFGIAVYELTESCSRIMQQRRASLDDMYRDLLNLGEIFSVQADAEALVAQLRSRINAVSDTVSQASEKPRVFLYDSGEDRPTTSGRLGMPQALIDTAGGHNIMDDVAASWTQVNWESVVERDPEVIVIVDYGPRTWQQKRDFLLQQPALKEVRAIRERRFIVLTYLEATPSVQNALAIEKLATALHPQLVKDGQH